MNPLEKSLGPGQKLDQETARATDAFDGKLTLIITYLPTCLHSAPTALFHCFTASLLHCCYHACDFAYSPIRLSHKPEGFRHRPLFIKPWRRDLHLPQSG